MGAEPATPQIIHPQKIKEGLAFRLSGWQSQEYLSGFSLTTQVKRFLVDWEAFRKGMNDWDFWRPPPVFIFIDDGLGYKGPCAYHGHPHVQVYPLNGEPAKCFEAVRLREAKR